MSSRIPWLDVDEPQHRRHRLGTVYHATSSNGEKLDTLHEEMRGLKQGQAQQTEVLVEIRDRL